MSQAQVDEFFSYKDAISQPSATAEDLLGFLSKLEAESVNRHILAKTKIGVTVARLKNHEDNRVAKQSRMLVDRWKELVGHHEKKSSSGEQQQPGAILPAPMDEESPSTQDAKAARPEEAACDPEEYCGPLTSDSRRNKAREVLYRAFINGVPAEQQSAMDPREVGRLAASIETALNETFAEAAGNLKEYSNQLRSIKANLGDKKNVEFNARIYMGAIKAEELASMPSAHMASDAKKKERQKAKKDALEACQSDWDLRNIKRATGQFPCSKCKSENTSYFQMQTRSADEPMTTFLHCIDCGHRWKF